MTALESPLGDSAWDLVEERVIEAAFGRLVGISMDSRGRVYGLDGQSQKLHIFGASGTSGSVLGRKGSGPGEFRGAAGILVGPGEGQVTVVDVLTNRMTTFSLEGGVIDERSAPGGGVLIPWRGGYDPEGWLWGFEVQRSLDGGSSYTPIQYGKGTEKRFSSFELQGALSAGGRPDLQDPFVWNFDPVHDWEHIWFGYSGQYRIQRRSLTGAVVLDYQKEYERVPYTEGERETMREDYEQGGFAAEVWDTPELREVVSAVVPVEGLGVLVLLNQGPDAGTIVELVGADGELKGSSWTSLDVSSLPLPRVRGGRIVAASQDRLGVQRIHVLRLMDGSRDVLNGRE